MVSKSKIEKRLKRKTNPELVDTIIKLKKTNPEIAKFLTRPRKKRITINLEDLNNIKHDVLIPGKVLSKGEFNNKIKIVAWDASEKAIEKIKKAGGDFIRINEELSKNPKLNKLKIFTK